MSAVIVKGRRIASEVLSELKTKIAKRSTPPRLDIFIVGIDTAIESFVARKKASANKIGVTFKEHRFPKDTTQEELEAEVRTVVRNTDGIVIQLPLPKHLDTKKAIEAIPPELDVDLLTEAGFRGFLDNTHNKEPPVGGAVREIIERHRVDMGGKKVLVIGKGHLVGLPVFEYFKRQNIAELNIVDKSTGPFDFKRLVKEADIIVSGTGVAGLIRKEMIKPGVVLLDAGTSGSSRTVEGDISYDCAEKASVFSRTPGGIGTITVAILFKNLVNSLH